MFGVLSGILLASSVHAQPARYQLEREVTSLSVSSGRKIDTQVRVNAAGQILFSTSVAADDSNRAYLFSENQGALQPLAVPNGFEVLEPADMNASGIVVGKTYRNLYQPNYAEAGIIRLPGEPVEIATLLDPTQSSIHTVTNAGTVAGAARFGTDFLPFVTTATDPAPVELPHPPVYRYFQVVGRSDAGEILLFVADDDADPPLQHRLALAAPGKPTELLDFGRGDAEASNAGINPAGDIAMVVRGSGGASVRFMAASDRTTYRSLTAPSTYDVGYNFQLNDLGQVLFAKNTRQPTSQADRVVLADFGTNQIYEFQGYRPFFNNAGETVYGHGGLLYYWASRRAGTGPRAVPVSLPSSTHGEPELLGINDASRVVLSYYNPAGTVQSLGLFQPVAAPPAPTPTPTPTPEPPQPTPVELRIEVVQELIVQARRVRNPQARANRLRRLNLEMRRLRVLAFQEWLASQSEN